MKLEKTETAVEAKIQDLEGDVTEIFTTCGSGSRCFVKMIVGDRWATMEYNKGQVEQLIYVLTLARNRMT